MRLPIALASAALIAIAAAACSGGQSSNYVAPPAAGVAQGSVNGPVTLSNTGTVTSAGTANGITGALSFGAGTGTVTTASSATAPGGTTTVVPASKNRIILASATSPVVYYVTITSPTGATLSGLPAVSLALTEPAIGTFEEAQWDGKAYTNVAGQSGTISAAKTAVAFPPTTTAITIPANGSIYLAFYQGNFPNATPAPVATPTNVIADSSFELGTPIPYGTPVAASAGKWTQCAISSQASTSTSPVPHPFENPSFTPIPSSTPGAAMLASGTALTTGTGSPAPTYTAVPTAPDGAQVAVLGGQFFGFAQADFAYNGLCQVVTIPSNPTLSMKVLYSGNETGGTGATGFVDFDVNVLDLSGKYIGNLVDEFAPGNGGDLAFRSLAPAGSSVLTPYVGQTVQIFVGIWTKAGSNTAPNNTRFSGYYFVDDFFLSGVPSGS